MRTHTASYVAVMVVGLAAFSTVPRTRTPVHQPPEPAARSDGDTIGGVVTGPSGPEAGVWVIAETSELATKFVKIVVTDDQGRYLLPDLPKATYRVWVRGYGLVDSRAVRATPGRTLNLTAVVAPDARAAAHYYPAGYWFSLIRVPAKSEFGSTGADGNGGASPNVRSQAEWIRILKSGGCWACHQLGSLGTREIPKALGTFESSTAAWLRRLQSGQAGGQMIGTVSQLGAKRALAMFADWTDRIAGGAVPPTPPRPQGIERNVVITDRRTPTLNANGSIYGALELSADYLPVLDPVRNATSRVPLTVRDPNTEPAAGPPTQASRYWGTAVLWTSKNNVHNPMFDERGRVWLTSTVRPPDNPAFCKAGSSHPSAKLFPLTRAGRHLAMYDPKTRKLTHIGTCFSTHHLMFAEDANRTLWTSGGGPVVGWLNTKLFDETGDEETSQGWTALILDANGNGKRDAYVEPDQPVDPAKDKRIGGGLYAVAPAPDGSVWGSVLGFPGAVIRLVPGSNPPETALCGVVRAPARPVRCAGRGVLPPRRRRGSEWRLLDGTRQRASGQLRSPQMQGTAQRTDRDGPTLSRGVDLLSRAAATAPGGDGSGQRGSQPLHLGRSVRRARPR